MQNFSENVEVSNNEKLGRHLIAAMDIAPGEMILEEKPLLITPHWDCDQMKCSQCFEQSFVMCKKCQVFPLCIDCSAHDTFDCEFFSTIGSTISKNLLVKNYAIFATLKLLLLMENTETSNNCDAIFTKNFKLNDYRDSDMWQEHETTVVAPLLSSGIVNSLKRVKVDADVLHQMCILIDANSFEVTSKDCAGGESLKGVYVFGAKIPHNCVPNTVIALDDQFNMKIYAAVAIKRGQVIYNSYSNPLMGTSQRQHQLRMTKNIECTCSRCLDPTELGTHMSSMKCKQCPDGYSVCELGKKGNWVCQKCNALIDAMEVHKLLAEVGEEMCNAQGDLHIYEDLLAKYSPHFHGNHFLLIDMKQNIATILSAILMNPMCGAPNKKILERKVQLCEEILPVVRAVLPGISKLYAIALYEYLMPFLELSELEFKDKDITKESYYRKLQMAHEIALDAVEMLSFEPPNSAEGHLAQRIERQKKIIEDNIQKFTVK